MPMLVSAGSVRIAATSPCASCSSTPARSLNSATRVVSDSGTGAPTSPARATASPSGPGHGERLVDRAVVAVGEGQDLRPPGGQPGEPDRPAVRVGRGQRERPQRQPEAAGQLGADPLRVGGRQHRGDARRAAPIRRGDRVDGRPRAVARHRAGVAHREVDVLVAVDVDAPGCPTPGRGRAGSRRSTCSSRSSAPGRTGGRRAAYSRGRARVRARRTTPARRSSSAARRDRSTGGGTAGGHDRTLSGADAAVKSRHAPARRRDLGLP